MAEPEGPEPRDVVTAGLCATCAWVRVVRNRRGSRFFLCRLAERDARYPRYPPLPVVSCDGHRPLAPSHTEETE